MAGVSLLGRVLATKSTRQQQQQQQRQRTRRNTDNPIADVHLQNTCLRSLRREQREASNHCEQEIASFPKRLVVIEDYYRPNHEQQGIVEHSGTLLKHSQLMGPPLPLPLCLLISFHFLRVLVLFQHFILVISICHDMTIDYCSIFQQLTVRWTC